ncbi:MAG: spore maturation protein [Verrucomicrobia bacterium]|nr:spore maturation protein [Verrucomicrobiota bacterium]MBI3867498.1 spore maturation protein [Verrucomicrobiota bacterium]
MLNYIWVGLVLTAVIMGGITDHLKEVTAAAFDGGRSAVMDLALPLIGVMAIWLGLMKLADRSGLVQAIARCLHPVLSRLFPDVPKGHPAMGSMVMNFSANMLGLANAATPLGLKAMKELERLNPRPGTATNAMCTFLAINTSSIQLIPASTIALLAAAGSKQPTAILGTALLATCVANIVGITSVKLLQSVPGFALAPMPAPSLPASSADAGDPDPQAAPSPIAGHRRWAWALIVAMAALFVWMLARNLQRGLGSGNGIASVAETLSLLAIPAMMSFIILFALARNVRVYEEFIEGAKEGFETGVRVIPYLVAMLVAVKMFRAAGGIDWLTDMMSSTLAALNFPPELLPLALIRPLSGSGANGVFADLLKTHGPDSLIARMGGTLIGSTETTFYVLAVYFGSVGVKRARHAVLAGLLADIAATLASVLVCRMVFH